jgi:hypothetical protein
MIDDILKAAKRDAQLADLLCNVREYTQVYLLAKQRQKGCDEMGEVATLKDEFIGLLEEMVSYCKERKYISDDFSYDIDLIAEKILKG